MTQQTNAVTETLRTLHRILQQLGDLRERLDRGPRLAQAHQANLTRLEAEAAALHDQAKKLRVATDAKQLQLSSNESSLEKRRMQLRQAGTNREFAALREEIAAGEMTNSVLEDEIIEAMDKLDKFQTQVKEAEAVLARSKDQADKSQAEIAQQKPLLEADVQRLEQEHRQAEGELPRDFREHYRRVVRGKGVDALAQVTDGVCGGCHHHIPVNVIAELMLSHPMLCKSCGRMLYLAEDVQAASSPAAE
jgi:predicted  nucleic acid-binding Zn-ribbon protein